MSNTLPCHYCGGENLHILGVLIDQGGAVTKIDGSGTRLLRGPDLDYVRDSLPRDPQGSTVHTVYECEACPAPLSFSAQSDTFCKGKVTRAWTALLGGELSMKELWRG